ncbi:MAG: alpha/beta fold hydrolase [Proteobacteria bacterium]|nr:alpha/beta fold hydrolase [Pseudomonadota bacterium]
MRLVTATGTLHGTLELPAGRGPFPVALIIAGSGPTDRNGNDKPLGLDTDCYRLLARYLVRRNVASLRYDKRGAGDDFVLAIPESQLRFQTYVSDAMEWGEKLRHDPRFTTLTVIGHSEGSLIGILAARKIPADGFVSIAGAGERASKLLLSQLKPKLPRSLYRTAQAIVAQLTVGRTVAHIPQSLDLLFRPSVQPYLISWFRYDPAQEIARLRIPVLIVQGERDLQVSRRDARALYRADPVARLILIPAMNHVMKDVGPSNLDNIDAYAEPNLPIDATLEHSIGRFILHLTSEGEFHHDN